MNNLLKLFALNRNNAQRKFEIVNLKDSDEATIYLYDVIVSDDETAEWWGGISPQSFIKSLNEITAKVINLRINCPGGDVFAGRAMETAIRQHDSKIIAHIDGYAASAASYVALGCDEVKIAQGGFFMIHKAWTFAFGNSDDLLKTADLLDKIDESLVATYTSETKLEADKVRKMMAEETWINANEAIEWGFADSIAESKVKASAWDFSAYARPPKQEIEQNIEAGTVLASNLVPDTVLSETLEPSYYLGPAPNATLSESIDVYSNEDHRIRQQQRLAVVSRLGIS